MPAVYFYPVLIIYVVFLSIFGINYFIVNPIPTFFIKLIETTVGLSMLLAANLMGRKIFQYFKIDTESKLEKNIFACGVGYGLFSTVMLLIGVMKLYYSIIIWLLLLGIFLFCHNDLIELINDIKNLIMHIISYRFTVVHVGYILLVFIPVALMFISCFIPPTYYDSLVYHLSLPRLYIITKKIFSVPFNPYTYFPQNMEMLYTAGLLLYDEIVPNIISFCMGVITLIGIYCFCNRFINKSVGIIAVILYVTTFAVMLLTPSTYVESGVSLFTLLAIYSYYIFLQKKSHKFLILTGIFSGLAFGTKYTAITIPFIITIMLFVEFIRNRRIRILKHIMLLNIVVMVTFSPWGIKNIVNVGNPVFPFLYKIIGYKNIVATGTAQNYFNVIATDYSHNNIFLDLLCFPFDVINNPIKFAGGFDILGYFGWITCMLLLPALIFIREKSEIIKNLTVFYLLYFIIWFITAPVMRFLFPMLTILSIVGSYILIMIWEKKIFILKYITPFFVTLFIISNFYMYFFIQSIVDPFKVVLGIEEKGHYLTRKLLNSPYPVFQYINSKLSDNDKILFVGEQRGFYCEKEYVCICVSDGFNTNLLIQWANQAKNSNEMISYMKSEGITHVLYNKKEGDRLRGYGIFNFSDSGKKNWENLLRKLKIAYSFNEVYLFVL